MHRSCVMIVMTGAAACGQVPAGHAVDASTPRDDDAAVLPDRDAPAALDRSCADVKARLGTTTDGTYVIDPDLDGPSYTPFSVYCAAMATPSPREYLTLVHTSSRSDAEPASNYSTHAGGGAHGSWTCDCGVITMVFSRARLDLSTMTLTTDSTFGVFADSTNQACLASIATCPSSTPFAAAASCVTNFDASGRANLDLRGTGFHVDSSAGAAFKTFEEFSSNLGFTSAGSVSLDAAGEIIELTGGGDCGGFGALNGVPVVQD